LAAVTPRRLGSHAVTHGSHTRGHTWVTPRLTTCASRTPNGCPLATLEGPLEPPACHPLCRPSAPLSDAIPGVMMWAH
jgi:hypothetical protein